MILNGKPISRDFFLPAKDNTYNYLPTDRASEHGIFSTENLETHVNHVCMKTNPIGGWFLID